MTSNTLLKVLQERQDRQRIAGELEKARTRKVTSIRTSIMEVPHG